MTFLRPISITALAATLAACSVFDPQPAVVVPQAATTNERGQLQLQLASGVYRCELGRSVLVQRDARNANLIEVSWQGQQRTLLRHDSTSGLPRYEDRQNGLLWIDLPWKSVLMDVNTGRPLANECKLG
ncbi:hypothetical protein [Accumulibacter sp.]|uniref:hypothetical protein n=1 Tax=Accumulibacter sp. TaxID=2053492 RepID=UPI0028C4AABF|nr:hypothetical protein [Accumulibacter sp.]